MNTIGLMLALLAAIGIASIIWVGTWMAWFNPDAYIRTMRRHGRPNEFSGDNAQRTLRLHRVTGILFSAAFLVLVITRILALIRPTP
jgi:hypothetical protein